MSKTPQGVVAVLTDHTGNVIASVSDFDRSGYGGFTLRQAQEMRVKEQLAFAVVRAYCSDAILGVFERSECGEFVRRLVRQKGFTQTIIPVGHPDE